MTDLKGNARVILPRTARILTWKQNLKCRGTFEKYLKEKCDKYGNQPSNLMKSELKGLKSLKERIKNDELVVIPKDKTGNFAVMSRNTYEKSGMVHTRGDTEVKWENVQEAQREINGHVSMLGKIFNMGKYWSHEDRIRETMLGDDLSVCPVTLVFKDHKGWLKEEGTVPPTRHVAGGHVGVNLYLSEIVSDIIEPLAGTIEGGKEIISTEDMEAHLEDLNESMAGWHEGMAWN